MTVRIAKQPVNLREKLAELERPVGVKGSELLKSETGKDAFNLIGAGRRNILINSLFEVSQRGNFQVDAGGSAATTPSNISRYCVDRWVFYSGQSSTSMSTQYVTLPTGEKVRSFKITATSTSAGDSWLHPMQPWEIQSWAEGQFFTLSCWVKTNRPGQRLRLCDSVTCWEIGNEIPNDGNWYYVTATQQIGKNLTIGGAGQFQPAFTTGPVTNGHYIEFALPQMELGKVATPFEYRSYGEELALCQRYYFRLPNGIAGHRAWFGFAYTTTTAEGLVNFPVPMRVRPTSVETTGTATDYALINATGTGINCNAVPSFYTSSTSSCTLSATVASGLVAGNATGLYFPNTNGYLGFSAEF